MLLVGATVYNSSTAEERAERELRNLGYTEVELGSAGWEPSCEGRFYFIGVTFTAEAATDPQAEVVEPSTHTGAVCFSSFPPFDAATRITEETPIFTGEPPG